MKTAFAMTPALLASRFLGIKEVAGSTHNPQIVAMLRLVNPAISDDETPWCSAFVNYIAFLSGCLMSRSLSARSWLRVGTNVPWQMATQGFHVVVLQRGDGVQPNADVLNAPGHVGFFVGFDGDNVILLGGNQGDSVSLSKFPKSRILGIREI